MLILTPGKIIPAGGGSFDSKRKMMSTLHNIEGEMAF